METPAWFEPFKKAIEKLIEAIFGPKTTQNTPLLERKITLIPLLGDEGKHVEALQESLNAMGASLKVDGSFGPRTQEAISTIQKANGLAGSGVLGPKTLAILNLIVVAPEGGVRERVYQTAMGEVGVKEIAGNRHNPRILEYHKTTGGFGDDETAWCASFVNWCLSQHGVPGTRSAAARSFLKWGKKTNSPKVGDVVVFWRGSRTGWQGHVAFYASETPTHINVLGGNQSNAVNIQAYSKNQLLEYRTYV